MTINRKRKQRGKSEAKQLHELSDTESANSGTIIDTPLINSYTCSSRVGIIKLIVHVHHKHMYNYNYKIDEKVLSLQRLRRCMAK